MGIPLPALSIRPPEEQQSPVQSIGQLLQLKNMQAQGQTQQLQQEALRQENAQREQQAKDLQATTAAARDWDGKDYDALSKSILKNGGSASAAMGIQQHGLNIKKTVSDIAATDATTGSKNLETFIGKHKAVGDALEGIEKVPDNQLHQAAAAKIDELAKGGILEPAMAQQLMQGVQSMQDPAALRGQIDIFAKASMGAKAAAEQEKSTAETRQKNAQAALEEMQAKYGTPATMEAKYIAIQQKLNQKQQLTADESSFSKAYEKNKTLGAQYNFNLQNNSGAGKPAADVAKQFGMSPEAFDQAAEKYYQTGNLPPVGRGAAGPALQKAIMNRTGELHSGASLAEGSAEYKANADSLKKLQGNLDSVSAFESTALKNLQLFRTQAQKVIDTGIPLLNAPLRSAAKMLGSQDQAGFETSLQVANNEIAKVTSSPGLSGVLSDSARKEVENYNPKNATIGQAMHVADILEQDMANRHKSYQDQINDIKGRMGGKMGGNASQPSSGSKFSVTAPNGKNYSFPDQASLDAFKQKAGIN